MTENQELIPTQDEGVESQNQHENTDSFLSLMECERPPKKSLECISIQGLIELCCTHKISSDLIGKLDPRINELYTLLDLNKIYGDAINTKGVGECVNHFKPSTVIVQSSFFDGLPVDFLSSFLFFSPKKLIIQILAPDQQFLVYDTETREIRFEHPDDDLNRSTKALNSVIQSSYVLETLELINCKLNEVTVILFYELYLKNLTLCNVKLSCWNFSIESLAFFITRRSMENLILRFHKKFGPDLQLLFTRVMDRTHVKMNLKSLEISISDEFFKIDNIGLIPSIKSVRINIINGTSPKTMNYIKKITVANPEINFKIHGFTFNQDDNEKSAEMFFNKRFQHLTNVTSEWGRWYH